VQCQEGTQDVERNLRIRCRWEASFMTRLLLSWRKKSQYSWIAGWLSPKTILKMVVKIKIPVFLLQKSKPWACYM